jgi:hypothetical protein
MIWTIGNYGMQSIRGSNGITLVLGYRSGVESPHVQCQYMVWHDVDDHADGSVDISVIRVSKSLRRVQREQENDRR